MNQQCKVCGEAAAGFHFGAFTCEGCKSFFGRTYNNLSSISECKNGGQCVINKKNRTSCKACRLRKCVMVGMSKSGSRYGRRSNWFKIHCLLQEQANNNNNNTSEGKPGSPSSLSSQAMLQNAMLYQNALQSFIPTKLPRLEGKKQGSIEELRSTPDSAASSMDETDTSPYLRVNPDLSSSPSPKSPFSDKEFLPFTPQNGAPSPSLSPQLFLQHRLYYASAFSAIKPGLSPKSATSIDHLRLFGGRSHDFLNIPALAGVAEDQNEPIDLSVKSKALKSEATSEGEEEEEVEKDSAVLGISRDGEIHPIKLGSPLDLTKQEIQQEG